MYTRDEVFKATLEYFGGDELATNVFFKYCLQDKEGNYLELTPDNMHHRLAREFARVEAKFGGPGQLSEETIYGYLKDFRYICPQGSPMAGIGNNYQNVSLANCFVIESPEDTMSGIFDSGRSLANLTKRRGGVGLDLSKLRPDGSPVSNSAKTSSGAASFADFYSNVGRMVGQNGRRAAIMLTMDVRHPDIEKFVTMKHDLKKVTGANVSVKVSDAFMDAVKNNSEFVLQWPVNAISPKVTRTIQARDLWNLIVSSATNFGEPGIIFWDTMLRNLPAQCYWEHEGVNPCSELILSAFDSCRLISISIKHLIKNAFTADAEFDFVLLEELVRVGQRLSDDLVELEAEKLDNIIAASDTPDEIELFTKIKTTCLDGRRCGLGTHGLADALARMCTRYDSDAAIEMVRKIYDSFCTTSYKASVDLAIERGAFPIWDWEKEKDNEFIKRLPKWLQDEMKEHGRRGISLQTCAPTGSVSILSSTSGGCEPVFRNKYTRRKKRNHDEEISETDFVDQMGDRWVEFEVAHPNVCEWEQLYPNEALPEFFIESNKIGWENRVKIQSVITSFLDHSVSSTINLPAGTQESVVSDIYMKAWETGCKGITVYVDGSRSGVLISKENKDTFTYNEPIDRPDVLECDIHSVKIKGEKWTVLVGKLEDKPYEVFCGKSEFIEIPQKFKTGQIIKRKKVSMPSKYDLRFGDDGLVKDIGRVFNNENFETAGRLISALLRHGAAPSYICEQLGKDKNEGLDSYHRIISRVLKKFIKDGTKAVGDKFCGSCGQESLIYQDGCVICSSCGWSKCQ